MNVITNERITEHAPDKPKTRGRPLKEKGDTAADVSLIDALVWLIITR
jgi:hypothetical protein